MELISQHVKGIMEECKRRARAAGLSFDNESLEYIVTNRDLIELSPKVMIPTLYDYWVSDVEVLKEQGKYKLYPSNPYETVINSRPAISFYNDNNPDWLNVMIFYHVLGHIDMFQNNLLFKNTWNDDFVGQALADKRLVANLRSEYGRWVDYVIEFARGIDNITGYFSEMAEREYPSELDPSARTAFYFGPFLQEIVKLPTADYYRELEKYNKLVDEKGPAAEELFFTEVRGRYPEFVAKFERQGAKKETRYHDLLQFIHDRSPLLKKEENGWMRSLIQVVRNTALYFQPQIRSKILNEGWASYWHEELFLRDERIVGHESDYARVNSGVTSISRVGLNPYAVGLRLIRWVEELADRGKMSRRFQLIGDANLRAAFDEKTGTGKKAIFALRDNFSDFMLINTFVDQEFVDRFDLFVVGKRLDEARGVWQYYIKSRKAEDYKQMLLEHLYHPPVITVDEAHTTEKSLALIHQFEGKQLVKDFIGDTLIGIEFLWGGEVTLETTEIVVKKPETEGAEPQREYRRVRYHCADRKIVRETL